MRNLQFYVSGKRPIDFFHEGVLHKRGRTSQFHDNDKLRTNYDERWQFKVALSLQALELGHSSILIETHYKYHMKNHSPITSLSHSNWEKMRWDNPQLWQLVHQSITSGSKGRIYRRQLFHDHMLIGNGFADNCKRSSLRSWHWLTSTGLARQETASNTCSLQRLNWHTRTIDD